MPVKENALSSLTSIHLNWNVVSDTQINVLGYQVYMDAGSNGHYTMVFNGKNKPGVRSYTAQNLQQARAYNFKIAAVNFNGVGPFSQAVTYFSCLPPQIIQPP